jgi:hypothetical protein
MSALRLSLLCKRFNEEKKGNQTNLLSPKTYSEEGERERRETSSLCLFSGQLLVNESSPLLGVIFRGVTRGLALTCAKMSHQARRAIIIDTSADRR